MKSILLFFFGYLIIPILKILALFINFKFCHIHTTRIGHQIFNFDFALLSVSKNTLLLCSHDKKVANNFILNFFKEQQQIFFLGIFKYFYFAIHHINPNSDLIVSWKQYQPDFSFYLKLKSKIKTPVYSIKEIKEILSKYKIKKDFVGLYARNNLYVEKYTPKDKNFHDFRNSDFTDYNLVIEYLNNKNNSIIKLGEDFQNEDLKLLGTKIFTSKDFKSNEEIDYFINTHSRYNVVSVSGIAGMSAMIRKKIVYVNFMPFNLDQLSWSSPGSLILPKKFFNIHEERLLTFQESTKIKYSVHQRIDPYKKNNLSVINNSPTEILDTIIEMEEKLLDNISDDSIRLNDLFWKSITDNNHEKINYLKNELKLSISTSFLKNNQNLF